MKSFIFLKFIILSLFFINVKAEQKEKLFEQNSKIENPYLSQSKKLKEISFENIRDILVRNNQEYAAAITVAAKYEENRVPYGVINTEGIDLIKIIEKPLQKFLVSAGVYVINPEIIKFIDSDEYFDMPTLINLSKENNFKVLTFPIY